MRNIIVSFTVGVGVGAGGAFLFYSHVRRDEQRVVVPGSGPGDSSTIRYHDALKLGVPQTSALRYNTGYVVDFDFRTRNPKWVLEHLSAHSVQGDGERQKSDFAEDKGIEPRFRSKLDDYRGSGYDRGHMAPAANHKGSQKAMDETFSLSNISPQVGKGFNRDYWARFEKFVKDLNKKADEVFVVTGPLFLPKKDEGGKYHMDYQMLGHPPALLSVPTHFYKVVVADASSGKHGSQQKAVGAFVMPNAPIDPKTPLTAFCVPLEALEAASGVKFFPAYLDDKRRQALDEAAIGWQKVGQRQLKVLDRLALMDGGMDVVVASNGAPVQTGTPVDAVAEPVTVGGRGAVHLCEHTRCRLPVEEFWAQGGKGGR